MSKPTTIDLLRQLYDMQKLLKSSDVHPVKKTELQKIDERHNPEQRNPLVEIENICALLPELIAAVKRGKDMGRAAYFVGMWHGIILNTPEENVGQVMSTVGVFNEFFESTEKPGRLH